MCIFTSLHFILMLPPSPGVSALCCDVAAFVFQNKRLQKMPTPVRIDTVPPSLTATVVPFPRPATPSHIELTTYSPRASTPMVPIGRHDAALREEAMTESRVSPRPAAPPGHDNIMDPYIVVRASVCVCVVPVCACVCVCVCVCLCDCVCAQSMFSLLMLQPPFYIAPPGALLPMYEDGGYAISPPQYDSPHHHVVEDAPPPPSWLGIDEYADAYGYTTRV